MWTRQYRTRKSDRLIIPMLCIAVLGYFGYHAFNGSYGISAKHRHEQRIGELEIELAEIVERRQLLESRTSLLSDGSIEKDILDEHARKSLGLMRSDEVVILLDNRLVN